MSYFGRGGASSSGGATTDERKGKSEIPSRRDADRFEDWIEDLKFWIEAERSAKKTDETIAQNIFNAMTKD